MPLIRRIFDEKIWRRATVLFRFAILVIVAYRLSLRAPQYEYTEARITLWWVALIMYCTYLLFLLLVWRRKMEYSGADADIIGVARIEVWGDLVFIGSFYFLGGDPESQMGLLMLFPLILGARYLKTEAIYLYLASLFIFLLMTILFHTGFNRSFLPVFLKYDSWQYFIVQASVFGAVVLPFAYSEYLREILAQRNQRAQSDLMKLLETGAQLGNKRNLEALFLHAVNDALNLLNCEIADLFLFHNGRYYRVQQVPERDGWFPEESYAPGEGLTGLVVDFASQSPFGKPVLENNASNHPLIRRDHLNRYRYHVPSKEVYHLLAVPLNGPNRTFGILRVLNKRTSDNLIDPQGFTEEDKICLGSVAAMVALSIAHERSLEKERIIQEMSVALSASLKQKDLCQQVTDSIVKFGYIGASAWQFDTDGSPLHLVARTGKIGYGMEANGFGLPNPPASHEIEENQRTDQSFAVNRNFIRVEGQLWGEIQVLAPSWYKFYTTEIHTLTTLVTHLGSFLENSISRERRDYDIKQLTRLAELSDVLSNVLDIAELQRVSTRYVLDLFQAERCVLYWINDARQLDLVYEYPVRDEKQPKSIGLPTKEAPYLQGFIGHVALTQKPLYLDALGYVSHPAYIASPPSPIKKIHAFLACPLLDGRGDLKGVIQVENKSRLLGPSNKNDADLIKILGNQIATVLPRFFRDDLFQLMIKETHPIATLSAIAQRATVALKADATVIIPYDVTEQLLRIDRVVSYPGASTMYHKSRARLAGITELVLQSEDGYILIPDWTSASIIPNDWVTSGNFKSCMAVRLEVGKSPIGIMYFNYFEPRSEVALQRDLAEAMAFAASAAKAINVAIRIAEKNHALDRQLSIRELALNISTYHHLTHLADDIAKQMRRVFQFDSCRIWIMDRFNGRWQIKSQYPTETAKLPKRVPDFKNHFETLFAAGTPEIIDEQDYKVLRYPLVGSDDKLIGVVEAGIQVENAQFVLGNDVAIYLKEISQILEQYFYMEDQRSINNLLQELDTIGRGYKLEPQSNLSDFIDRIIPILSKWLPPQGGILLQIRTAEGLELIRASESWMLTYFQHLQVSNDPSLYTILGIRDNYSYLPIELSTEDGTIGYLYIVTIDEYIFSNTEKLLYRQCAEVISLWIAFVMQKIESFHRLEDLEQTIIRAYHGHLKSNLGFMRSTLENLLDDEEEPLLMQQQHYAQQLHRNVLELMSHVRKALIVEQIEENSEQIKLQECSIDELIRAAKEVISPIAMYNQVEILYHHENHSKRTLKLDRDKIIETLQEVIHNGVKYNHPSGRVEIWVQSGADDVSIYIHNTGIEIPHDLWEKVFEKSYRAPEALHLVEGVGLGLWMARRILKQHGGYIRIVPNLGVRSGTTLEICLPHLSINQEEIK